MEGNTFREIFDPEEREMLSECVNERAKYYERLYKKHFSNTDVVRGAADKADMYKEKMEKYYDLLIKVQEESF